MIYAYILATILLLAGGVTTCNYAQKASAKAETAELEAKAAIKAQQSAEANLAAVEKNAAETQKLQVEAEKKARALDAQYAKAKEEIRALKNRKPVPKECAAPCRNDFEPVAGVLRGMRDTSTDDGGGAPTPSP